MWHLVKKLFGDENNKKLKKFQKFVDKINLLEPETKLLKDADFPKKTEEFKKRLEKSVS